jgi:hypothetical protein
MPVLYVTKTGEVVEVQNRLKASEPTGPRPPLPGLLKWVINIGLAAGSGYKAANIFHILAATPSAVTKTAMDALLAQLITKWHTRFGAMINGNLADTSHQLVALDGSGLESVLFPSSGITGSSSGLAANVAAVLSWQTSAYWRGGKFRTYMPGVLAANAVGSPAQSLTTAAATAYSSAGAGLATDVATLTLGSSAVHLGGVSYYSHYAFRPTPLFFTYNGCTVHTRLDSQRRRLGKEGI